MKAQLQKLLTKFEAMTTAAEDLAGSDNEKTAERYDEVSVILNSIVDSIEEAIGVLES